MMDKQQNKKPLVRFPEFKEEWEYKQFNEFLIHTPRPKIKPKDNYLAIGIRSHFKGTFQKLNTDPNKNAMDTLYEIKENDFLVNITFAWEGALAIVPKEDDGGFVSHRFPAYTFEKGFNHLFFKYHFFKEKSKHQLGIVSPGGAGRNRVMNKKDFIKLKLPFPQLKEQQKIAHFFTTLDKKLNQLEKKKNGLEQYKKGMMQQIFSQELRFKDENENTFPDWEEKKLGSIGETYNGLSDKTKEDFGLGKKYIQYKQIFNSSEIDLLNCDFVNVSDNEKQNKAQFGDIFFTVSSETPNEIGMSSVLLNKIDDLYLNSFCFGFRPNSLEKLNPFFSKYLFRNEDMRQEIVKLAQGSTRYNMSKIQFIKIKTFLPPAEEQTKIADFLSKIDDKINAVNEQIEQTKTYKKGLLQKMFF